jgi:hypothetical protein
VRLLLLRDEFDRIVMPALVAGIHVFDAGQQ